MIIYLFREESSAEVFAFSIDVTGQNIPPLSAHTEWIFLEAIDTLKFLSHGKSMTSSRSSIN